MLKQFLKTLFIGVLSAGLTTNPVFAQATAESRPVVTTDANGTKSATATYKFQGVNDNDMIASIVMLATGYLASRLLVKYKPFDAKSNVPGDVMVAAAGGAAFIAGEVMSNVKFKGTMEEMTAEVTMKKGTPNQEQIEYLQKLKTSYEEAKKTTQTKKMLQTAAAAAFAVAASTAAWLAWTEYSAFSSCLAALNLASKTGVPAEIKALTATGAGTAAITPYTLCITELEAFEKGMISINTKRQSPGKTSAEFAAIKGPMEAADKFIQTTIPTTCAVSTAGKLPIAPCKSAIQIQSFTQIATFLPLGTASDNSIQILNNILYPNGVPTFTSVPMQSNESNLSLLEQGINLLFPKAQASWLPMLGLTSGALVGYFMTSYAGIAEYVDYWMFVPFNRIMAWGTLGALSLVAAKSSDNTIKKLDENIIKIDKILSELGSLQKSIATQNVKGVGVSIQNVDPFSAKNGPYSPAGTVKSQCMTSNATSNCSSLEDQLKSVSGFTQLPPALQTLATQSANMADSLSGSTGVNGAAMGSANSLAGKQAAINGMLKKTQNSLNNLLKKNGKNPVDFNKEQDKFYKGMAASVKKALMQKGTTAAGFMAAYGGSPLDSSAIGKPIDLGKESKTDIPLVTGQGSGAASEEEKKDELKFEFEEAPAFAANTAASGGEEKAEYDVKTDEIHNDNGPSIFELISNRYLQSGYPKLLEEEPTKK
jgi:predicted RNA-binding protein with TRAM domain